MPDARIITVCDALVSAIDTAWTGKGTGDAVFRVYLAPVTVEELNSLVGRQVYVFPGAYSKELETRRENRYTLTIGILTIERYTEAGPPPTAWLDDRTAFVEQTVYAAVDYDGRTMLAIGSRRIWTDSIEVETFNLDMLNEKNLFWSELTVTMKEIA